MEGNKGDTLIKYFVEKTGEKTRSREEEGQKGGGKGVCSLRGGALWEGDLGEKGLKHIFLFETVVKRVDGEVRSGRKKGKGLREDQDLRRRSSFGEARGLRDITGRPYIRSVGGKGTKKVVDGQEKKKRR